VRKRYLQDDPEYDALDRYLKTSRRENRVAKRPRRKYSGKKYETGVISSTDPCRTETLPGEGE
jgi:hypothetical protein